MFNMALLLDVTGLTMQEDEFLEVFFNIVRYSLPYFQWTTRDLEEDTLYLLEGAAYGFAYHGE